MTQPQTLHALRGLPLALELEGLIVLRDRRALFYAFLVPALLYPLMMAVLMFGYERMTRYTDESVARVSVAPLPTELDGVVPYLLEQERVEIVSSEQADANLDAIPLEPVPQQVPDALRYRFEIKSDTTRPLAAATSLRVLLMLDDYRAEQLQGVASRSGVTSEDWQVYELRNTNLAEGAAMGRFVQSAVLPVMFVVMVALGCFYPAIDSIAGERERGSWETTLTIATPRMTILLAKLLMSAALGCAAGLINVFSMAVALEVFFAELLGELGQLNVIEMSIPFASLPMLVLVGAVLSITMSACMMVLAAFARSFREGQAMVAPFYLVILPPALMLADPDLRLSIENAWLPIVSLGLALRSSLLGEPESPLLLLAICTNVLTAMFTLWFAEKILRHDEVLEGNLTGGLFRFLRRLRRAGAAR